MPGLVPGIHVLLERAENRTWMAVTSTAMTEVAMVHKRNNASLPRLGDAADAFVGEAEPRHLFRAIDVAQIADHGPRQFALHAFQTQRALLHPLGHHHPRLR